MASDTVMIELTRATAQRLLGSAPSVLIGRAQKELHAALVTALEGSNGSE